MISRKSALMVFIRDRFDKIESELNSLKEKQSEMSKKVLIIETKRSMLQFIIKNWWKLAAFLLPVLFMLGEIGLQIRKLVP